MPRKENLLIKSYQFKLPKDERLVGFQELTITAAKKLLEKLWSKEWLLKLGTGDLKAYKIINEVQVELEGIYFPSRV